MENSKVKIFFFGSGAFAVPVLEALCLNPKIQMAGIVTQPDKPAGRKMILTPTPVGRWCDMHGIECRRAPNVNVPEFLETLQAEAPDIIVVVSFGQLLREALLNLPKFCCLNVHASLLPKYRGASPITSVVLNGEHESGVCFMRMDKGLDTGAVFESHRIALPPDIRTDTLEARLSGLAAEKIVSCILNITQHHLEALPQNHDAATVSKKIRKGDGSMKWAESAMVIDRKIRAFHPWPGVCFRLTLPERMVNVKITAGRFLPPPLLEPPGMHAKPGTILKLAKEGVVVACGAGAILIERVIPEGKKEMSAGDFARGFRLAADDIFADGPVYPPKNK